MARSKSVGAAWMALGVTALSIGVSGITMGVAGCASTEFVPEGPGQPPEKTKGTVPPGSVGVCRRIGTKKPPIMSQTLWDHISNCTARTPDSFIRAGFSRAPNEATMTSTDVEADKQVERLLTTIGDANEPKDGNNKLVTMLRGLQDYGLKQPLLRDRVTREASRPAPCDYTYMLNIMVTERAKMEPNDQCTAYAYDPKEKKDVCLFDMAVKGVPWLTSSYACMTRMSPADAQSCHSLCAYDDYCVRQVSCTASDIDLMMCAAGICLPEPRTGIY